MSREQRDEVLRKAFQDLAATSGPACSRDDIERIWSAVRGDLPVEKRHAIVERLASDPACAEAWRVAQALAGECTPATEARQPPPDAVHWRPPSWRAASWLAAAAGLVLAVSIVLVTSRDDSGRAVFRDGGAWTTESLVPADATLPRSAFRLRWSAAPSGARYEVRVTTEDLRPLVTATDLTTPEITIEAERLAALPSGSRVLWQVHTTLVDGERALSPTFVTRIN